MAKPNEQLLESIREGYGEKTRGVSYESWITLTLQRHLRQNPEEGLETISVLAKEDGIVSALDALNGFLDDGTWKTLIDVVKSAKSGLVRAIAVKMLREWSHVPEVEETLIQAIGGPSRVARIEAGDWLSQELWSRPELGTYDELHTALKKLASKSSQLEVDLAASLLVHLSPRQVVDFLFHKERKIFDAAMIALRNDPGDLDAAILRSVAAVIPADRAHEVLKLAVKLE